MKTALLAALAALLLTSAGSAHDALSHNAAVESALAFIRATQQDDGGFQADLAFGPGQTFDAIYAIRATGLDPTIRASATGGTPADFLATHASTLDAPLAAKGILAAIALGLDPRAVGGSDLVAVVEATFDPESGRHHGSDFTQALIVIALDAAGAETPAETLDALRAGQHDDSGWGFDDDSTPDTTAIVLQALIATSEVGDAAVAEGLAYLTASQHDDGGWGFDGFSNVSSTAFVVQALIAARIDPESSAYTRAGSATPITYLLSQQQADGSFAGYEPAFATNQAVPALAGRTFANAPFTPLAPAEGDGPPPTAPTTGTGLHADGGTSPVLLALLALAGALAAGGALTLQRRA